MSETYTVEGREVTPGEAAALGAELLDWARANGAGESAVLDMAYPLRVKKNGREETIDRVTLRRPTADDVIATATIANDDLRAIRLVERCCDLAAPLFKTIDAADLVRLAEMLGGFR